MSPMSVVKSWAASLADAPPILAPPREIAARTLAKPFAIVVAASALVLLVLRLAVSAVLPDLERRAARSGCGARAGRRRCSARASRSVRSPRRAWRGAPARPASRLLGGGPRHRDGAADARRVLARRSVGDALRRGGARDDRAPRLRIAVVGERGLVHVEAGARVLARVALDGRPRRPHRPRSGARRRALVRSGAAHPEWAIRMPAFVLAVVGAYVLYNGVSRTCSRRAGLRRRGDPADDARLRAALAPGAHRHAARRVGGSLARLPAARARDPRRGAGVALVDPARRARRHASTRAMRWRSRSSCCTVAAARGPPLRPPPPRCLRAPRRRRSSSRWLAECVHSPRTAGVRARRRRACAAAAVPRRSRSGRPSWCGSTGQLASETRAARLFAIAAWTAAALGAMAKGPAALVVPAAAALVALARASLAPAAAQARDPHRARRRRRARRAVVPRGLRASRSRVHRRARHAAHARPHARPSPRHERHRRRRHLVLREAARLRDVPVVGHRAGRRARDAGTRRAARGGAVRARLLFGATLVRVRARLVDGHEVPSLRPRRAPGRGDARGHVARRAHRGGRLAAVDAPRAAASSARVRGARRSSCSSWRAISRSCRRTATRRRARRASSTS